MCHLLTVALHTAKYFKMYEFKKKKKRTINRTVSSCNVFDLLFVFSSAFDLCCVIVTMTATAFEILLVKELAKFYSSPVTRVSVLSCPVVTQSFLLACVLG